MNAYAIVYFISQLAVGDVFMWNEPGNLTFEVLSIHPEPEAWICGRRIPAYMEVQWSDEDKPSTMNLGGFENQVRTGQVLQMNI